MNTSSLIKKSLTMITMEGFLLEKLFIEIKYSKEKIDDFYSTLLSLQTNIRAEKKPLEKIDFCIAALSFMNGYEQRSERFMEFLLQLKKRRENIYKKSNITIYPQRRIIR